jgi:hypothetical protein
VPTTSVPNGDFASQRRHRLPRSATDTAPLAEAWKSGANTWTTARREEFANNLQIAQLIEVSASSNRSKGDSDSVPVAAAQRLGALHLRQGVDLGEVHLRPVAAGR